MSDKECECRGLSLFAQVMEAVNAELGGRPRAKALLASTARDIFRHLKVEFDTPKYRDHQEEYGPRLSKLEESLKQIDSSPLLVMDEIRDTIHRDVGLQQMLTCGPVYSRGNETESTRVIGSAQDAMSLETIEVAQDILRKHSNAITCGALPTLEGLMELLPPVEKHILTLEEFEAEQEAILEEKLTEVIRAHADKSARDRKEFFRITGVLERWQREFEEAQARKTEERKSKG